MIANPSRAVLIKTWADQRDKKSGSHRQAQPDQRRLLSKDDPESKHSPTLCL